MHFLRIIPIKVEETEYTVQGIKFALTGKMPFGRKEITKQLRFKVVETEEELKEGVIEFVNYPKEVTFLPNIRFWKEEVENNEI